jgi:hypothetical protein
MPTVAEVSLDTKILNAISLGELRLKITDSMVKGYICLGTTTRQIVGDWPDGSHYEYYQTMVRKTDGI